MLAAAIPLVINWEMYDAEHSGLYPTIQELGSGPGESVGWYEFLVDQKRKENEVVNYIVGADIDFVFRGNMHFGKVQSSPAYKAALTSVVRKLKAAKPGVLVQGGVTMGTVRVGDLDPYTGDPLSEEQIIAMSFKDPRTGDPVKNPLGDAYILDMKHSEARDYLVGRAGWEIDCGVDSIFFDMPYYVPRQLGIDESSYDSYILDVFERTRQYAREKGRSVLITANNQFNVIGLTRKNYKPTIVPGVDICTIGFAIDPDKLELVWDIDYPKAVSMIEQKLGDVKIHAFLDYGWHLEHMPLSVFGSASLEDQQRLIREMDRIARENGILPVYPLHIYGEVVPSAAISSIPRIPIILIGVVVIVALILMRRR